MSAFTQNAMGDEDSIAAGCIFITGILETWTEFGVIICATEQETHAGPIVSAGELEFQHTEYIERINNEGLLEYEEEAVASVNNK